jgi:hypothetical protein
MTQKYIVHPITISVAMWNEEVIFVVCKQKTKEVLKLLNDILIERSLPLRPDEKDIINYCLGIFMEVSSSDMQCKCEFQKLHDRLADIQPA